MPGHYLTLQPLLTIQIGTSFFKSSVDYSCLQTCEVYFSDQIHPRWHPGTVSCLNATQGWIWGSKVSSMLNLEIDRFMRGRKKAEIHWKTFLPNALNRYFRKHLLAGHQFSKEEKANRKCFKKKKILHFGRRQMRIKPRKEKVQPENT